MQVVHIDDDPAHRFVVEEILTSWGRSVMQAEDLATGYGQITSAERVVALVDQRLPDGDGIDFIRRLRSEARDDVLVLLTGLLTEELAAEAKAAGADHVIEKPTSLDHLEVALAEVLGLPGSAGLVQHT